MLVVERSGKVATVNVSAELVTVAYVALAMLLGAVIGIERELADRPAGFRTHMLVCGAATLLVRLSNIIVLSFAGGDSILSVDPLRITEAIIAGISFLGAGTIFRRSNSDHIEGLTTAASLLFVAAIGICVALDRLLLAIITTVLVLVALRGLGWLEAVIKRMRPTKAADAEQTGD
jgi:putative Mg2+ transporter-C (MgtC) family protein